MSYKFIGLLAAGAFSAIGVHAAIRSGLFGKRFIQISTMLDVPRPPQYAKFAWRQTHHLLGTVLSVTVQNKRFYSTYEIQYTDVGYIRNIYIHSVCPINFYLNDQPINFSGNTWINPSGHPNTKI
jgi:hypothetical protein